ncbi:M949_RS01915 family surface polysaccharide biosynthesis protein [Hymenobacter sp. B81]|uniref:M949_RS01915 family surface polysaccharide biosynthesis protein n=1 Tax=Hymenobacter sp. B81 TaxID=3344878 RepID=UPI0037DCB082
MQRKIRFSTVLLGVLAACQSDPKTARLPAHPLPAAPAAVSGPVAWTGAVDSLTAAQLPPLKKLPGKLLEARRWTDALGENLLVVYRTPSALDKSNRPADELPQYFTQLFARQYTRQPGGTWQELWRLQDAVRKCPFDMWLGPLPGSICITDLDQDGTTETTLIYKLTCRSDVSPSNLKLIMHEGAAKYALRGQMVVQYDSVPLAQRVPANVCCIDTISKATLDAPEGYELLAGRYRNENDFRQAPRPFLGFARAQWRRYIVRDEFEQL